MKIQIEVPRALFAPTISHFLPTTLERFSLTILTIKYSLI